MSTNDATIWWHLLCAIAGLNLIAWTASTAWLHRNRPDGTTWPHQRLQAGAQQLALLGIAMRGVQAVLELGDQGVVGLGHGEAVAHELGAFFGGGFAGVGHNDENRLYGFHRFGAIAAYKALKRFA